MNTMNISFPDSLKFFVDEQVAQHGYGTSSEYVRVLIRKDANQRHLRGLLLEGAASAPAAPAGATYFDTLRERVQKTPSPDRRLSRQPVEPRSKLRDIR